MDEDKKITDINVELSIAVNLLRHQHLTKLLLDELKNASLSRIINTASHFAGGLDNEKTNLLLVHNS